MASHQSILAELENGAAIKLCSSDKKRSSNNGSRYEDRINNFARVTSEPKTHLKARFRQTSYKDLVFVGGEFLSVVGAQNESLRIILMYYMFKY